VVSGSVCVGLGEQLGATDAIGPERAGRFHAASQAKLPAARAPLTPVTRT
jgi:hypothetical protein